VPVGVAVGKAATRWDRGAPGSEVRSRAGGRGYLDDDLGADDEGDPVAGGEHGGAGGGDDGGATATVGAQPVGEASLGDGVQGAGGVVEHQHREVDHQGPGQRHPLALAARQVHPSLADRQVEPARQRGHVVTTGGVEGVEQRIVGGIGGGEGQVVAQRPGYQPRVVPVDHHHVAPQPVEWERSGIDPSDDDGARSRIGPASQQVD
jgi:hypothetical protein